jgi:uncharacterized damage-inducible protein DinB
LQQHLSLAAARDTLTSTQREFLEMLADAGEQDLQFRPAEGVWTLTQVLAHISEARGFFADEVRRVRQAPGSRMGRTMDNPGRLQHVREHAGDSAVALRDALQSSHRVLIETLDGLRDDDLAVEGEHVKFGRQTLGEFIQHFVVEHDQKHVAQARRCIAAARADAGTR